MGPTHSDLVDGLPGFLGSRDSGWLQYCQGVAVPKHQGLHLLFPLSTESSKVPPGFGHIPPVEG